MSTIKFKKLPHNVEIYFPEFVGDIVLNLYIDKEARTAYRGIYCIFLDKFSNRYYEVGQGNMALEGTGGGRIAAELLFNSLRSYRAAGHKIAVIPRIIDNEVIDDFRLLDTKETYQSLYDKSNDLYHYSESPFDQINKNFQNLYQQCLS